MIHAYVMIVFVPQILAFSYVNTVLFVNINISYLQNGLYGVKDQFYLLVSVMGAAIMG